jgi:hypothetical protein
VSSSGFTLIVVLWPRIAAKGHTQSSLQGQHHALRRMPADGLTESQPPGATEAEREQLY